MIHLLFFMKYVTIKKNDVANGPGIRVSIFVSGCNHRCQGCFNEEAWNFDYGTEFTDDTINEIICALEPSYISGLSLLGGEPFEHVNQVGLLKLVKKVKMCYPEKDIWAYSGFLFDRDIIKQCSVFPETSELLSFIDVLVDGKFVEEKKSPNLRFRGSSNQRVIDVQESLRLSDVCEIILEKEKILC